MFNDEDYIKWGKKIFEKAKEINRYEIAHKTKIVQIIEDIKKKYALTDEIANYLSNVDFRSFAMKGYIPGPEEVKDYWLAYVNDNPYSFQHNSWEQAIRRSIEGPFNQGILDDFKGHHFFEDGSFDLTWGGDNKINICVSYLLNYYQVVFAIQVIEKLTHCKVTKISLWYFTYELSVNMHHEVVMAIDDIPDKHEGHPFVTKEKLLDLKVSSFEDWYKEIEEFKNYIEKIDNDTFECLSCGESIYEPGKTYFWCWLCKHYIDRNGNCISDDCETCTKEDESVDISKSTDNEIDFPECKTCGDANDVSDPGESYWWCSHCEHSIDQDGDCVSDECETCEKDPFIAMNGPFYLFFDTETTGVPRDWKAPITNFDNWPRIVQLAWLIYDNNGTQILKNEFIIKPSGFEIPIEASNVHGITTEYALEHGTPIEDVLLKFEKHCEKSKYLIAHNINFDSKVTSSEYLRILSRNPISKLEKMCTMESSTNYCKIPRDYGYKWPKLSELHVKLFGVDFEGAHDALADIEATAKCFWEMRKLKLI
jgi:DNA polymerase III epsilon subunit-like protein